MPEPITPAAPAAQPAPAAPAPAAAPAAPQPAPAAAPAQPAPAAAPAQPTEEPSLLGADPIDPNAPGTEPKGQPSPNAELEVKIPENAQIDTAVFENFKTIAKEVGLTSAQAQKLIDFQVGLNQKFSDGLESTWKQTRTEWVQSVKTDKEYGGSNLDASLQLAKKAVKSFATPEFRNMLNEFGIGDHPEMVRFMVRVGKAISEDKVSGTAVPNPAKRQLTENDELRMRYPSMKHLIPE